MDEFEDVASWKNESDTSEWEIVAGSDTPSLFTSPNARAGHGMVRYRNSLYMFGGYSETFSSPQEGEYERYSYAAGPHYNTVHEFDLYTRRWKELVATSVCGNMPRCRRSCSVVEYGGSIYIFGGLTMRHEKLSDMWEFNIERCEWSRVEYMNVAPPGRSKHTAIVYLNKMYIFGGHDGIRKLNETYEFDMDAKTWSRIDIPPQTSSSQYIAPARRCKHTAVLYEGSMYVLGGYQRLNDGNAARTDLHRLDLHTRKWHQISMSTEQAPEALQLHTAVVSEKDECMYVIGGKVKNEHDASVLSTILYSYHFPSHAWTANRINGNRGRLIARQRHAAVLGVVEITGEDCIFVFGGYDLGKERYFEGLSELRKCTDESEE